MINCLNGHADRYPGVAMGSTNWSGIIADTTLHDSDNWSYKFAEEDQADGWRFLKKLG